MISCSKVNLGKYPGPIQLAEQIINAGERIFIFDGNLIQLAIVHAHSQAAILLLNKQHM